MLGCTDYEAYATDNHLGYHTTNVEYLYVLELVRDSWSSFLSLVVYQNYYVVPTTFLAVCRGQLLCEQSVSTCDHRSPWQRVDRISLGEQSCATVGDLI